MKKSILILIIVLYVTPLFSKQIKIGSSLWYSEDIEFTKLIKIAEKQNKPILMVFSAKWCLPCKRMKNDIFKKKEFKEISKNYILQYIEETTDKGKSYIKRFNISVFPSVKVLNKDGFEIIDTIRGYRFDLIEELQAINIDKKLFTPTEELSRCNFLELYKQTIKLSEKHLKEKKIKLSNLEYYFELIKAYLKEKQNNKALILRDRIREYLNKDKPFKISGIYLRINNSILKTLIKSDKNLAVKIINEVITELQSAEENFKYFESFILNAIDLNINLNQILNIINKMLKNSPIYKTSVLLRLKARIYYKKGNLSQCEHIYNSIINNDKYRSVFVLGPVVDSMLELKIVNKLTLKAAKIIVGYYKVPYTYKTLSKVYEELNDYKNAINSLMEAKKLLKTKKEINKIEEAINKLTKIIKHNI